jgi:hypothetical protein
VRKEAVLKPLASIAVRWVLMGLWTALFCYLLLWPSEGTAVHDVSVAFGGTDWTDAAGHVVLAFVETALIYSLLCHYIPARRVFLYTLGGALALGLVLELAQHWVPARGVTLMDLSANWLGTGMSVLVLRQIATANGR